MSDPGGPHTAIMPAGGWRILYTNPDGTVMTDPLIGWAIRDGYVVPLAIDGDRIVSARDLSGRICHFDQDTAR